MAERSAPVTSVTFRAPELLAQAIPHGHVDPMQLSKGPAPSRLSRILCPQGCLDLVEAGPAMFYRGVMPDDCYTLMFVLRCEGEAQSFNFGTRVHAGYMGFFPPGSDLDATNPAGCVNAILTVPVDEFHAAMEGWFPALPDRLLKQGAAMRAGAAERIRLSQLLTGIEARLRDSSGGPPRDCLCGDLQSVVLPAFIDVLQSGCTNMIPRGNRRFEGRLKRLRMARGFIAGQTGRPLHITDVCAELGMSKRGLENLFEDLMGIGPHAYILKQRLHDARLALLGAGPSTGLVKQAALGAGFQHFGRFARDYREVFGESPSETLAHQPSRGNDPFG
ncbi:MAG: helix-turn-helix domain-containing protein [Akkermansiaceae bacterium]|nr:helix-turn-helix domain-containing protein [Akkermansiaceae bacterium]MCP5547435.1 helix-turn-helix domain-containing protein [Akkermansiaceae bacterium]